MLPRFLNSRFGFALIKQLRARELAREQVRGAWKISPSIRMQTVHVKNIAFALKTLRISGEISHA